MYSCVFSMFMYVHLFLYYIPIYICTCTYIYNICTCTYIYIICTSCSYTVYTCIFVYIYVCVVVYTSLLSVHPSTCTSVFYKHVDQMECSKNIHEIIHMSHSHQFNIGSQLNRKRCQVIVIFQEDYFSYLRLLE